MVNDTLCVRSITPTSEPSEVYCPSVDHHWFAEHDHHLHDDHHHETSTQPPPGLHYCQSDTTSNGTARQDPVAHPDFFFVTKLTIHSPEERYHIPTLFASTPGHEKHHHTSSSGLIAEIEPIEH